MEKKSMPEKSADNKRPVDTLTDEVISWWRKNVVYVGKREIKTWKGALIVMFVAGIAVSIIWSVKTDYKYSTTSVAAPNSTISFNPSSHTTTVGSDFVLNAVINPGTNAVNAVALRVTFDQTRLRLDSINASTAFPLILMQPVINNTNGTGEIDVAVNLGSPPVTTTSNVASFSFRALATATNSPVNFTTGTIAAAVGESGNVIVTRNGATVTINMADTSPPTGGSITYTNGYFTTASVALVVADGTDASGINTASRIVQRRSASLSAGSCSSYGSWSNIAPAGTYPNFTDNSVVSGNCYQYQYLVSDNAPTPNQAVYTSTNVARIDTGAPSGGSVSYTDGYYTSASVAITANDGSDSVSGLNTGSRIVKRRSATLSAGACGSFGSWSDIAPTGTYPNFTDTNVATGNCYQYQYLISDNAGNQVTYTGAGTARVDTVAPSGGSIAYINNYLTTASAVLTVNDGTDAASGINTSSRVIQRRSATFSANTCATYGSWSNVTTTGTYPNFTDNSVVSGNCYQYQYRVADAAGNQTTYTSTSIAKVDTVAPSGGSVSYVNGFNVPHSVSLSVADGSDSASGINTASRITQRRSVAMASGVCGATYGSWENIAPSGTYPSLSDSTIATGNCYQYRYLVSDNAGLQAIYSSSNSVKITYASDVSLNGEVDIFDFNLLYQNFNVTSCGNIADMNRDCVVNIFDYNLLYSEYGRRV